MIIENSHMSTSFDPFIIHFPPQQHNTEGAFDSDLKTKLLYDDILCTNGLYFLWKAFLYLLWQVFLTRG